MYLTKPGLSALTHEGFSNVMVVDVLSSTLNTPDMPICDRFNEEPKSKVTVLASNPMSMPTKYVFLFD